MTRLIDADELKKVIHCEYSDDLGILEKIDNAPTVEQKEFEQVLQPIKVNIPEDIKDKLIEELSKPRKVILDESKTVQDCVIAYGDGYETARRLFERPHGEWIRTINRYYECPFCHGYFRNYQKFCGDCGADMRKGETECQTDSF